jgi:hypothetical protein
VEAAEPETTERSVGAMKRIVNSHDSAVMLALSARAGC